MAAERTDWPQTIVCPCCGDRWGSRQEWRDETSYCGIDWLCLWGEGQPLELRTCDCGSTMAQVYEETIIRQCVDGVEIYCMHCGAEVLDIGDPMSMSGVAACSERCRELHESLLRGDASCLGDETP